MIWKICQKRAFQDKSSTIFFTTAVQIQSSTYVFERICSPYPT